METRKTKEERRKKKEEGRKKKEKKRKKKQERRKKKEARSKKQEARSKKKEKRRNKKQERRQRKEKTRQKKGERGREEETSVIPAPIPSIFFCSRIRFDSLTYSASKVRWPKMLPAFQSNVPTVPTPKLPTFCPNWIGTRGRLSKEEDPSKLASDLRILLRYSDARVIPKSDAGLQQKNQKKTPKRFLLGQTIKKGHLFRQVKAS